MIDGHALAAGGRWRRFPCFMVAFVIAACGGADQPEPGRQGKGTGLDQGSEKLTGSWAPASIAFSLNPGSAVELPVTLTTKVSLRNARVVFVPDLRNAVTVTPETIPALEAGKSVTVTLRFSARDARKVIAGVVLLYDRNATISWPLPVKVDIVEPEVLNGLSVPPEPPADLNNATLAGFDINGNGVRDDVERVIAGKAGGGTAFDRAMAVAKTYQRYIVAPTFSQAEFDAAVLGIVCFEYRAMTSPVSIDSPEMRQLTFSTAERRKEWGRKAIRLGPRTTNAARECTT